jgi:hypothetical protein
MTPFLAWDGDDVFFCCHACTETFNSAWGFQFEEEVGQVSESRLGCLRLLSIFLVLLIFVFRLVDLHLCLF